MAKRKTLDEQIELAQKELKEREARIKMLLGRQRSKADSDRTHRLCKRGGLMEKLMPELITLTDKQIDIFIEKCLLTDYTRKVINELSAQNESPGADLQNGTDITRGGGNTATKPAEAPTHTQPASTPKPANSPHNGGANGNSNGGNGARRNG